MNDQQRAAMQMALEALDCRYNDNKANAAINALREALAQQQGEPVAWISAKESFCGFPKLLFSEKYKDGYKPVYLAPPSVEAAIEAERGRIAEWLDGNFMSAREYAEELRRGIK